MTTLITGPMFCGKSSELMRHLEKNVRGKKHVCLIRPKTDTRDFFSHSPATQLLFDSFEVPIFYVESFDDFVAQDIRNKDFEVVGIDEVQFIKNAYEIVNALISSTIYIAGLLSTSECTLFDEMIKVLPYCDNIIKLNAVCSECGNQDANYTYYKYIKTNAIEVGGSESYQARCWHCFMYGEIEKHSK